jgi:hypothetical protein
MKGVSRTVVPEPALVSTLTGLTGLTASFGICELMVLSTPRQTLDDTNETVFRRLLRGCEGSRMEGPSQG